MSASKRLMPVDRRSNFQNGAICARSSLSLDSCRPLGPRPRGRLRIAPVSLGADSRGEQRTCATGAEARRFWKCKIPLTFYSTRSAHDTEAPWEHYGNHLAHRRATSWCGSSVRHSYDRLGWLMRPEARTSRPPTAVTMTIACSEYGGAPELGPAKAVGDSVAG